MSSFAEFAKSQAKSMAVLVELTPGYVLSGFTKTGGYTSVYQIAMSRFETGGITSIPHIQAYRPVVGVQENATALTVQTTIAAVDAGASRYCWDEPNGILYVHTSTGASPDTFTSYMALVRFYLGSKGIVLNLSDADDTTAVYYLPWLSGGHDQITQSMQDALSGISLIETAEITVTNGHGFWNTVVARDGNYVWKNKIFQLLVGGSYNGLTLKRSQYAAWSTMQVETVYCDESIATFTVKPLIRATEQELPVTPFFTDTYPNLGSGVAGNRKWIGYGRATITPDLVDSSGNGVYCLADAAYQTLFAVNSVTVINTSTKARTLLTVGVDYTVNLTTCVVTIINATYTWQSYTLEIDVSGKPDGSGSYLKTAADIVKDILTTFLSVPASLIDTAAFTLAATDAPQAIAVWLKAPRAIASILSGSEPGLPSISKSVMATVQQTRAGLWTIFIWKPGVDPATALSLRKADFARFTAKPKLATIFSATRVFYGQKTSDGTWSNQLATDLKTQYRTGTTDTYEFYTFLTTASDALILAQRYQLISGAVSLEVEFEERGSILATANAGDRVLVTFSPAPTATGAFASYPMELLEVSRSLLPVLAMAGRLGDLRGIGPRVGVWTSGAPAYGSSSAAQKATNGFWCDANGQPDSADATTKNTRIWW